MIRGFALGEYLSIGTSQPIAPLTQINVFVGTNNSGKSNVLKFINENLAAVMRHARGLQGNTLVSRPHADRNQPTTGAIAISATVAELRRVLKPSQASEIALVEEIHKGLFVNDLLWLSLGWPTREVLRKAESWGDQHAWHSLWASLTSQRGGDMRQEWIPNVLHRVRELVPAEPSILAIPVDRLVIYESHQEEDRVGEYTVLRGKSIVHLLSSTQSPDHSNFDRDRQRFKQVEQFLRIVTDDDSAELSVPHTKHAILVRFKGQKPFPLADLGSGIEQVILHAVVATSVNDSVVTFEEPELHLHPVLQRQLISYLRSTSNQYFISTHSAHFIDEAPASTFHVRLIQGESQVERASTDAKRHQVCADLGYRPSDIVQANCVIWVEGPSDRIYLRYWLQGVDSHLSEHIHYSVMFYGGKLLSHLSAGETDMVDDGLKDLIQLRLLNRQVAVIIDSDKKRPKDEIRDTKRRVKAEIEDCGGLVWITAGREIENYISKPVMVEAVEAVSEGRGQDVKGGQYAKTVPAKKNSSSSIDKVAVAIEVEKKPAELDILDLRFRLVELAAFIRNANGLPQPQSNPD